MNATINYTTDFAISADGTRIGYRQLGKGKGLILVHGGMMASQRLMKLGECLADQFTVYIPDRRGRALSDNHRYNPGLAQESEDLQALINKTGAENVYGLSAGAIIVLQTALNEKSINKIVLHEPPILTNETSFAWAEKYQSAMDKGNYGKAFVAVVHGTDDPSSLFNMLPGFITAPVMDWAIKHEAKNAQKNADDVNLKALVAAMPYDIKIIEDSRALLEKTKEMTTNVLLIKGLKSQPYLRSMIDKLRKTLPNPQYIELPGLGHTVSDNDGKPAVVAAALKQFFID